MSDCTESLIGIVALVGIWCTCPSLIGCNQDQEEEPTDDDCLPSDDDTGDDDTGDDTDSCDDQGWSNLTVTVDASCEIDPGSETWVLHKAHSYSEIINEGDLHIGRFWDENSDGEVNASDPMQIWCDDDMYLDGAHLATYRGQLLANHYPEAWQLYSTVGEVDGDSPGIEAIVLHHVFQEHQDHLSLIGSAGILWSVQLPENSAVSPWLTDLNGDGDPELLVGNRIIDASSGQTTSYLEGMPHMYTQPSIAADLDLDGAREIISGHWYTDSQIAVFASDGGRIGVCREWAEPYNGTIYAVGELDGDTELEFVAAGTGFVTTCDSDGTQITEIAANHVTPAVIGVGEIDGDPEPEIVVACENGVFAYDENLVEIMHWSSGFLGATYHPFTLSDLDGDGIHEILVKQGSVLVIIDGEGNTKALSASDQCTSIGSRSAPSVVDVDGDTLAEIVVTGWTGFAVLENKYGGWLVSGSDLPWPGNNKYPFDRDSDGRVLPPSQEPWSSGQGNVWQGQPVGDTTLLPLPDLGIESCDVCVDPGEDDALITIHVANYGQRPVVEPIHVQIARDADGEVLGQQVVETSLHPGIAVPVQFSIQISAVDAGIYSEIDAADVLAECDESNNSTPINYR